jgi:Flp pilus assembly protein TadD
MIRKKGQAMQRTMTGLAAAIAMLAAGTAYGADDSRLAYNGHEQMRQGHLASAEIYLKKAVAINPTNGNALLNLGVVCHKTDRSAAAGNLFRKILAIDAGGVLSISGDSRNIGSSLIDMARNNLAQLGNP